jgi:hypothetical protein
MRSSGIGPQNPASSVNKPPCGSGCRRLFQSDEEAEAAIFRARTDADPAPLPFRCRARIVALRSRRMKTAVSESPEPTRRPTDRNWFARFRGAPTWLDAVVRVVGGVGATSRMLGRDRSTIRRWATGDWPIPSDAAERLARRALDARSELTIAIAELRRRAREGEKRVAAGMARRREALNRPRRKRQWPGGGK